MRAANQCFSFEADSLRWIYLLLRVPKLQLDGKMNKIAILEPDPLLFKTYLTVDSHFRCVPPLPLLNFRFRSSQLPKRAWRWRRKIDADRIRHGGEWGVGGGGREQR